MRTPLPLSRTEGLLTEELDDDLLVYDTASDSAHRLNRTAAIVWRHCDGERDLTAMIEVLRAEVGELADEDLVRVALDDLAEAGLLRDAPRREAEARRLSRRRFIRRVGTVGTAALALPVVSSIVAPTPAAAGTPASCTSCTCTSCACACGTSCGCACCSTCSAP